MIRRAALLGCGLLLAGCGFTPVYGPEGEAGVLRGAVLPDAPADDAGFAFVARVEDRLGRAEAPRFALGYALATEELELAIDGSNNITRYNLEGALTWTLTPAGSDAVLARGVERSFTAYSATASTISTLEAERDARRRLMVILADAVVARLLARAGAL